MIETIKCKSIYKISDKSENYFHQFQNERIKFKVLKICVWI
jgi:hypothetical protein